MSANNISGKVALVTGAGRGAGRLIAQELGARGAIVAANDISPVNVDLVVAGINSAGGRARAYVHDIAKKVAAQAMLADITADFGRIDILVNCANVRVETPVLAIDEWDLHRVFEVNAIGTFLMIQSVGRIMSAQHSGIIATVAPVPDGAPATFIASRAGLPAATARLAAELGEHGIRVLTIDSENPLPDLLAACQQGSGVS